MSRIRDLYQGERACYLIPVCSIDCTACPPGKGGKIPHRRDWQHEPEHVTDLEAHLDALEQHLDHGNLSLVVPEGELLLDIDKTLDGDDCTAENYDRWAIHRARKVFYGYPMQVSGGRIDGKAHGIHVWVDPLGWQPGTTHYDDIPFTVRTPGQQAVVEPSIHASGAGYQWWPVGESPPPLVGDLKPVPNPALWQVQARGRELSARGDRSDGEWRKHAAEAWDERLRGDEIFNAGERHEATTMFIWKLAVAVPLPSEKRVEDLVAWAEWFMAHRTDLSEEEIEARRHNLGHSAHHALRKRRDFIAKRAEAERPTLVLVANEPQEPESPESPESEPGIDTGPLAEFPVGVLPEQIKTVAYNLGDVLQVDPKLVALVALAHVSVVAAGRARVEVFHDWKEQLSLFVLLGVESGGGKSPMMRPFTKMLEEIEAAERGRRRDRNARILEAEGDDRWLAPKSFSLFETSPTPAAFTKSLGKNNSVMSVISPEGRALLAIFDGAFQSPGKQEDATPFLSIHSGDPIRASRATREAPPISDAAGAICLMSQPDAVRRFMHSQEHSDTGLSARFLTLIGESRLGHRKPSKDRPRRNQAALARFQGTLEKIWGQGHAIGDDEAWPQGPFERHTIPASPASAGVFLQIDEALEQEFREGGSLCHQRERGAKLVGWAARVAGLFHLVEEADWRHAPITANRAWRAWEVARFTIGLEAAAEEQQQRGEDEACERVMAWIRSRVEVGEAFTFHAIQQGLKRYVNGSDHLREILHQFAAEGVIEPGSTRDQHGRVNRFVRAQ